MKPFRRSLDNCATNDYRRSTYFLCLNAAVISSLEDIYLTKCTCCYNFYSNILFFLEFLLFIFQINNHLYLSDNTYYFAEYFWVLKLRLCRSLPPKNCIQNVTHSAIPTASLLQISDTRVWLLGDTIAVPDPSAKAASMGRNEVVLSLRGVY